jgi:hypothetical protein
MRKHIVKWMAAPAALACAVCAALLCAPGSAAAAQKAVVQTTQADWSGAAHAVVDVQPAGGPRGSRLDLFPAATSDWIIRSYGDYFYLIGRYFTDSLAKFHVNAPETPVYQVSVLPQGVASANPHDLIFVNANKAYMPMYGLTKCWIINPQDGAQTGELDLSAYAGSDGVPEMHAGTIVNGRLFLLLQRLDQNNGWDPSVNGYIAVFDTATDQEIDTTGGSPPNGLKGIGLPGRNPQTIQYLPENGMIYVGCTGKYPGFDPANPALYTGGIVRVNPSAYAASLLVDDGPDGPGGDHPYGAVAGVFVVSAAKGYFVGYKGWGDNCLFPFNPSTGTVGSAIPAFSGKNLVSNETGAALDENGLLWISSPKDHSVLVFNPATETVDETVNTNLNPGTIAFCPPTIPPGLNEVNAATGTGRVQVEPGSGVLSNFASYPSYNFPNAANKPPLPFVDGLVGFTVDGVAPGGAVDVTVTFPTARSQDAVYYKLDAAGYTVFPPALYTPVDKHTVVLRLTDGDAYDTDNAPGSIGDPGGWAMSPPAQPATAGDSGSGGGCFVDTVLGR